MLVATQVRKWSLLLAHCDPGGGHRQANCASQLEDWGVAEIARDGGGLCVADGASLLARGASWAHRDAPLRVTRTDGGIAFRGARVDRARIHPPFGLEHPAAWCTKETHEAQ